MVLEESLSVMLWKAGIPLFMTAILGLFVHSDGTAIIAIACWIVAAYAAISWYFVPIIWFDTSDLANFTYVGCAVTGSLLTANVGSFVIGHGHFVLN